MKIRLIFWILISCSISSFSQVKGIVLDSISGEPIPYVSIWVENENFGTTSEENGEFSIHITSKSSRLLFNVLGYEKKTLPLSESKIVKLKPTSIELNEVIISKKLETKKLEIGKTSNAIFEAFPNGPKFDLKFFPYLPSYKKTRYIKYVTLQTDSKIDNAILKLHFYTINSEGLPGEDLLVKDFIVTLRKGVFKHQIDISNLNLTMPKNGLFVGFEKLMIEQNRTEQNYFDKNSNTYQTQKLYFPFILYGYVESNFKYTFTNGKWEKEALYNSEKNKIYQPAINLILTN